MVAEEEMSTKVGIEVSPWQRKVKTYFSHLKLTLWRGEDKQGGREPGSSADGWGEDPTELVALLPSVRRVDCTDHLAGFSSRAGEGHHAEGCTVGSRIGGALNLRFVLCFVLIEPHLLQGFSQARQDPQLERLLL